MHGNNNKKHLFLILSISLFGILLCWYSIFFYEPYSQAYIKYLFFKTHSIGKDEWISLDFQITINKWLFLFISDGMIAYVLGFCFRMIRDSKKINEENFQRPQKNVLKFIFKIILYVVAFLFLWILILALMIRINDPVFKPEQCEIISSIMLIIFFIFMFRLSYVVGKHEATDKH